MFNLAEQKKMPSDFNDLHREIISKVRPYTMTSDERLFGLIESVKYIAANNIEGDFVECGVWKGGSMMTVALTLKNLGITDKKLYLYDTYTGLPTPNEFDKNVDGISANTMMKEATDFVGENGVWCASALDEVKQNLNLTGYPIQNLVFVKGDVLETIPKTTPEKIALLRLDTDWYESTKHEMECLFPKLTTNGVLIIDDYGYWQGAKKAIDEYIQQNNICILLNRLDETGRVAIKN